MDYLFGGLVGFLIGGVLVHWLCNRSREDVAVSASPAAIFTNNTIRVSLCHDCPITTLSSTSGIVSTRR